MNVTALDNQKSKMSQWLLKRFNCEKDVLHDLWENMRTESMCAKSTMKNICTAGHQCFTAFCQLSTSNAKLWSHGIEESAITELLSHGNMLTAFVQGPLCGFQDPGK